MERINRQVVTRLGRGTAPLTVVAAIVALLVLTVRVLVHFPFYDETIHAHFLWLISDGQVPGVDFFCFYPALGYFLVEPIFRLLPESAWVLLALRLVSVTLVLSIGAVLHVHGRRLARSGAAGVLPLVLLAAASPISPFLVEFNVDQLSALAAVAAMAICFREPSPRRVAAASALSLLSALIMPKYALSLAFGLVGLLAAAWREHLGWRRIAASVGVGGGVTILVAGVLFALHSTPFVENFRSSLALNTLHQLAREHSGLARTILKGAIGTPVLGLVLALGVAGWARRSWGRADAIALGGVGILVGTVALLAVSGNSWEQYQAPAYLSLAMFGPFAAKVLDGRKASRALGSVLAASTALTALVALPAVAREFKATSLLRDPSYPERVPPAVVALGNTERLLRLVPRGERVVALWVEHPIFRRDVAGLTADAEPSFTTVLPPASPLLRWFDPKRFRAELERHPPALISPWLLDKNFPQGCAESATAFAMGNPALYQVMDGMTIPDHFFWVRKDLLK